MELIKLNEQSIPYEDIVKYFGLMHEEFILGMNFFLIFTSIVIFIVFFTFFIISLYIWKVILQSFLPSSG